MRRARAAMPLLLIACGSDRPAAPVPDSAAASHELRDSLAFVLTLDSTYVWLTPGRIGTASDGTTCREYGLRVGPKGKERMVPLLYVRSAPMIDLGGRLLSSLSTDCVDGAVYEIDPETAQPKLLRGRE